MKPVFGSGYFLVLIASAISRLSAATALLSAAPKAS
jgi:hypothetical protein